MKLPLSMSSFASFQLSCKRIKNDEKSFSFDKDDADRAAGGETIKFLRNK